MGHRESQRSLLYTKGQLRNIFPFIITSMALLIRQLQMNPPKLSLNMAMLLIHTYTHR